MGAERRREVGWGAVSWAGGQLRVVPAPCRGGGLILHNQRSSRADGHQRLRQAVYVNERQQ